MGLGTLFRSFISPFRLLLFCGSYGLAPSPIRRRVGPKRDWWAAVEVVDIAEVSGLFEVTLDEAYATPVVEWVPDSDCLGREATIPLLPHPATALDGRSELRAHRPATSTERSNFRC